MQLQLNFLLATFLLHLNLILPYSSSQEQEALGFAFEGFSTASPQLRLDGKASITRSEGLLRLTTSQTHVMGHAFYRTPIPFRDPTTGSALSFSSTFVFAIVSEYPTLGGNGIAFALAPTADYTGATGSQYLGLLNSSNNGDAANHLLFVELDSIFNPEISDINDNHVGIDVNSVISANSTAAGYYDGSEFRNLTLISGEPMQVWVDYDSTSLRLDVTLASVNASSSSKPPRPLLSNAVNLSSIVEERVYVGFSSSTGSFLAEHYILGWSFQVDGKAKPLNVSALPKLPEISGGTHLARTIWVSVASVLALLIAIGVIAFVVTTRIRKFSEVVEDWEAEYGGQRFSYRELYRATDGFSEKRLLGVGGFGRVYRGVLPSSNTAVAVKRVSHESKEGTKEFVAELASLGHLRHRNLVQLYGYCRRKRELMLVYEFMPNGSLDKLLFPTTTATPPLSWPQRLHVIKGVAFGLCYLHEGWEKVVIHRDVKASNVLLDGGMSGKLGDFGLARLYDHGSDPRTTHVVGTVGYLAPELLRTGRATKATDVYAFGVLVLEVVTGRRAMGGGGEVLSEWVGERWRRGDVREVVDGRMDGGWVEEEEVVGRVVGIGVRCCHPVGSARPEIKQVVGELGGDKEVKVEEGTSAFSSLFQKEMVVDRSPSEASPFATSSVLWTGR